MATIPTHPILRYFGGKWRLAPWIIRHFPAHTCYCEPFGGAAGVLLRKSPSQFEIYNDLDSDLVTFFRVVRERPDELMRALFLTPFSREEYSAAYEPAADDIEKARRLFVLAWQGYGGPRKQMRTGWKYQKRAWHSGRADQLSEWAHAIAFGPIVERLRNVQIECDEASSVIRRFDGAETLFYVDPPYPTDTRNERWSKKAYQHELAGHDHCHLANQLNSIKGLAIISTYPNEVYDEIYAGWTRKEKTCQTMNKTIARELLYISPRAAEALQLK